MKQPVNEIDGPSGGWSYVDPRTGIDFKDHALQAILGRVYKSWLANDIPIPDNWADVVRHEICEQRPDIECREIGEPERFTTFADVARFASTLKNWLATGAQWVPQEEAERRASICLQCHENKTMKMCLGCTQLKWLAERSGMPTTSKDAELKSCRVCGCVNSVAVHVPKDALDVAGLQFPANCWKA